MAFNAAIALALDHFGMIDKAHNFRRDADLLHHFAQGGLLQGLADFHHTARQ